METVSLATPRGRLIAFGVLGGVLALVGPRRLEGDPSLCIFRTITGRPCPACGMTRAGSALLRGQVSTAAHYNKLVFPAVAITFLLLAKDLYEVVKSNRSW